VFLRQLGPAHKAWRVGGLGGGSGVLVGGAGGWGGGGGGVRVLGGDPPHCFPIPIDLLLAVDFCLFPLTVV